MKLPVGNVFCLQYIQNLAELLFESIVLRTDAMMVVDAFGLPIDFEITGAEVHDCKISPEFISKLPASDFVIADKGYDNERLRDVIRERTSTRIIPRKNNSKTGNADIDWRLYKYRYLIEIFLQDSSIFVQ